MDATTFLTQQHDEVKQWFAECEALEEGQFKRRSELVAKITQVLRLHTQVEEEILYPAGKNVDHDLVLEAFEEHHMIRILLEEIEETAPSNERFMAKLTVLKEMVTTHVEEEEGTLFPEMKDACGMDKLNDLGNRLQERFKELEMGVSASR